MPIRLLALALLVLLALGARARADALVDIRQRNVLRCAVSVDTDDYSDFDGHGDLSALGTDYCRAYAAAILGDPSRIGIEERGDEITALHAVRDGRADIAVGSTPDPSIGLGLGLIFAPSILIDGQGFLADPALGIHHVRDINSARVCFIGGPPPSEAVGARLGAMRVAFRPFEFSERGEMMGALATGHCNLVTADVTELANLRLSLPALTRFEILPETITTDPFAPAVRAAEMRLLAIVTAIDDGLLQAEESGLAQANAASQARSSHDPIVRRLTGTDGWIGPSLGLDQRWLLRAIEAVGNRAEIYRRDVGDASKLRLPAGPNRPVAFGGALFAPPVAVAH